MFKLSDLKLAGFGWTVSAGLIMAVAHYTHDDRGFALGIAFFVFAVMIAVIGCVGDGVRRGWK